mgnify:CR=1 FL=1
MKKISKKKLRELQQKRITRDINRIFKEVFGSVKSE